MFVEAKFNHGPIYNHTYNDCFPFLRELRSVGARTVCLREKLECGHLLGGELSSVQMYLHT